MKTRNVIALSMMTGVALGAIAIQGLHAQAKPPVYYIAQNEVTNPDAYIKEFVLTNQPIVKAAGGRFLIAGGKMTALDGDAPKARIVVQVWDSMEKLQAWFNSPENQTQRKIAAKYAKLHAFAVEGVPQ